MKITALITLPWMLLVAGYWIGYHFGATDRESALLMTQLCTPLLILGMVLFIVQWRKGIY
jgi:hypothetical protein